VEIFGEGVRANAAANAGVQRNDGVLAACAQADPDSDTPPKQCRALIRLELSPIAKQVTDVKRASEHAQESCGKGFVRTRGKCTVLRKKPTAPICTYERMKDCRRLCKSGDGLACFKLAYAYISRDDNSEANLETSFKLVERSCQLKVSHGCLVYGDFLVRKTRLGDAVGAYTGACMMGSAPACELAGGMYLKGTGTARNPKRAAVMNRRGCDGGEHAACVALSGQYAGGIGVAADQKRSFVLNQRACNGDSAMACGNVGFHYEFGVKVNKDLAQSRRLYARACGLDRSTCLRLGILRELGHGQRGQKAKQAFEWSCARPKTGFGALSCGYLNRFYGQSNAVAKDALKGLVGAMIPRCKQGLGRACGFVGMALVVRRSNKAPGVLKRACGLGDQWACRVLKRLGGR
jgi:TPR repeat protein